MINTEVNDGPHDNEEEGHDLVLCGDEGGGTFLYDGSDLNGVEVVKKLLLFLLAACGELAVDLLQLAEVVESPDEPNDARGKNKCYNKHI